MNDHSENNKEDEAAGWCFPDRDISDGICPDPSTPLPGDTFSTSEKSISVMVFRVKSAWFALKTSLFHKVADIALPHTVPGKTDNLFRGIVNAGGELELYVSLADILGIPDNAEEGSQEKDRPCLVVVGEESNRFAFAVDDILGVRSVFPENPAALPVMSAKSDLHDAMPVISVDGKKAKLLNEEKLFYALTRSLPNGDG
jgi:chemotaxis-related protein WspD